MKLFLGLQLCTKYNLEAEEFCDQWYAFTISNLGGAPPTLDNLENLERKEYQGSKGRNRTIATPNRQIISSATNFDTYPLLLVNFCQSIVMITIFLNDCYRDIDTLGNVHSAGTPKQQKVSVMRTEK